MPLAHQPSDIESYVLKENEVKIFRPRYNPVSGDFLGIEYCVGVITVHNGPQEQFFDYGYNKDNPKFLYCTQKRKILNSFRPTIFGQHRMQYEGVLFYFYLLSTVDRNEKINKYMSCVNLKLFTVSSINFGKDSNPAEFDFNSLTVVNLMKKVALHSSQNLKRNANAFLSTVSHDNNKLLWPGGKRIHYEKFINNFYRK